MARHRPLSAVRRGRCLTWHLRFPAALKHVDIRCKFREALRREFYANCAPNSRFKRDQHFKAELVPFATHEVGNAGLCNAEALGCIRLGELVLLDVEAKVDHQIRPHLEHGGFGRIKAKVDKNIAAGLGQILFHDRFLLPRLTENLSPLAESM